MDKNILYGVREDITRADALRNVEAWTQAARDAEKEAAAGEQVWKNERNAERFRKHAEEWQAIAEALPE